MIFYRISLEADELRFWFASFCFVWLQILLPLFSFCLNTATMSSNYAELICCVLGMMLNSSIVVHGIWQLNCGHVCPFRRTDEAVSGGKPPMQERVWIVCWADIARFFYSFYYISLSATRWQCPQTRLLLLFSISVDCTLNINALVFSFFSVFSQRLHVRRITINSWISVVNFFFIFKFCWLWFSVLYDNFFFYQHRISVFEQCYV